jgi:hypothetical protein
MLILHRNASNCHMHGTSNYHVILSILPLTDEVVLLTGLVQMNWQFLAQEVE